MKKVMTVILILLLTISLVACAVPAPMPDAVEPDNPTDDNNGNATDSEPEQKPPENSGGSETPEPPAPVVPVEKKVNYVRAKVNSLNLRAAPSTSSRAVGQIDSGELVAHISTENGWHKTYYRSAIAYISASSSYTDIVKLNKSDNYVVENAITIGVKLLGTPYELGAERLHWGNGILNNNFTGVTYDCSSLMQYMYYKSNKVLLDVTTRTQAVQGAYVSRNNLNRGDLIFYTNSSRLHLTGIERIGHVGIYLGDNYMLHTASDHALIEQISSKQWSYYITARRVA